MDGMQPLYEAMGHTFELVSGDGRIMSVTDKCVIEAGKMSLSFAVHDAGLAMYVYANGRKIMHLSNPVEADITQDVHVTVMLVPA